MRRPCMDPAEAAEWERWNAILPPDRRASDPCEDCTVAFATEMRLAGRCNSWPTARARGAPRLTSAGERQERRRSQWREAKQRERMRACSCRAMA